MPFPGASDAFGPQRDLDIRVTVSKPDRVEPHVSGRNTRRVESRSIDVVWCGGGDPVLPIDPQNRIALRRFGHERVEATEVARRNVRAVPADLRLTAMGAA
ncbi:hypothetical protein GCM10010435_62480 [Winogradskya consettensis]|uniref:Uncharacterized protein n=1 Tax=Winogradskya consettensis TaxID=113560 RepID=A0A919T2B8_9ACTN|nr:hypothetical protein Aco04nite_85200 [Actinoplanes consettensis]